ncbi:MAG: hypothetical protein ACTHMI_12050 [Mucilaginibacter sp.]
MKSNADVNTDDYHASMKKINAVWALPRITKKDLEGLTQMETDYLYEQVDYTYHSLEGRERKLFIRKIQPLLTGKSNKEAWEHNHSQITGAIEKLTGQTGVMPSHGALARETGLSRQTIVRHVKAGHNPSSCAGKDPFKKNVQELISRIYASALEGNIEAARLYLQVTGAMPVAPAAV